MFYGTDWTVTRSGSVLKFVRCEQCNHDYAYWMHRKIQLSSFSVLGLDNRGAVNRAEYEAQTRLQRSLSKSCDPVPCPECGHYQPEMINRVRRTRAMWLWNFGIMLIPLSVLVPVAVMNALGPNSEYASLTAGIVGVTLLLLSPTVILLRMWFNRNHDPNGRSAGRRIALGRRLALTPKEYRRAAASRKEKAE